ALRVDIDAEEPGRVQTENLILDGLGQLRIAVTLDEVVAHAQAAQALDLTFRTAVPDRIGAPQDVIGPGHLDHLAEHVQAGDGIAHRELMEGAAQLKIDVADARVAAQDAQDVADPGNLLRIVAARHGDAVAGAAGQETGAAITGVVDDEIQVRP